MVLKEWINAVKDRLNYDEVLYLVKAVLGIPCYNLDIKLNLAAQQCLNLCLQRRLNHEPLAKIVGIKPFWDHYFMTNDHTLDPRPETEFLIEKIDGKPRSILELGVGSGCLILSILSLFSKSKGVGVDISHEALLIALENSKILGLNNKVSFIINNWAFGISGSFDLVIANPPYVSKDYDLSAETLFDPDIALFGDINTYVDLLDSLSLITFRQLLLEVPENLINEVVNAVFQKYSIMPSFERIYDSDIFCLSLLN